MQKVVAKVREVPHSARPRAGALIRRHANALTLSGVTDPEQQNYQRMRGEYETGRIDSVQTLIRYTPSPARPNTAYTRLSLANTDRRMRGRVYRVRIRRLCVRGGCVIGEGRLGEA